MLVYNTMRFGTDVFTLSGTSGTTPVDPPDDPEEPTDPPVTPDDPIDTTLPTVSVRIGGKIYNYKIVEASA